MRRWIGNLAPIPTTFFGRGTDLEQLDALIGEGRRVLTLVGSAGVGKTTLARRFAERVAERGLAGGLWFCDLTDARNLVGVLAAAGRALDIPLAQVATIERAVEKLAESVAARGPTLLVIDNCEQVIEPAAHVVARIAELAPEAILIATSRESLRVAGERVHQVLPLAVEGEGDEPSDAVRLFIDRAKGVWPAFSERTEDRGALEEIAQRLDGLPLAIELAAARVGALSLATIRQRLQERFSLLAGGLRFATERQRTMRGAIAWSWDLLSPAEQRALAESSIFQGGFSLEAAERVFSAATGTRALDLLQSLTEKSLVAVAEVPELGTRRYRLFESIRDYAMEKLEQSGGFGSTLERHRRFFVEAGLAWAKQTSQGEAREPRAHLEVELQNLSSAHRHALEAAKGRAAAANDAFDLLVAISDVLKRRGPLELLHSLLDATLEDAVCARADPTRVARALRDRAYSRQFSPGASVAKIADLTRAIDIARSERDVRLEVECLSVFSSVELLNGNPEAARAHVKLALSRVRTMGDSRATAKVHADLGSCELSLGHLEEARVAVEEAIALSRKADDRLGCASYLARLAEVLLELGRFDEAILRSEEGVVLCTPFGHHRILAMLSGVLGTIEFERRNLARARAHFDEALRCAREWGAELLEPIYRAIRAAVLADEDDVEGARAELDWAGGQLARFADETLLVATVGVGRGHLDLARARACRVAGDTEGSERHRVSAERRLDALSATDRVFEDLRPMQRRLERELARTRGDSLASVAVAPERTDALLVAEDGRWFRPPGGARVDLSQKPNLQQLLVSLTTRRIRAVGEPMSVHALFRVVWPGDRAGANIATNRVRVAITRLRKLGLGDLLVGRGGYLLDPEVPIVIARNESNTPTDGG